MRDVADLEVPHFVKSGLDHQIICELTEGVARSGHFDVVLKLVRSEIVEKTLKSCASSEGVFILGDLLIVHRHVESDRIMLVTYTEDDLTHPNINQTRSHWAGAGFLFDQTYIGQATVQGYYSW